MTHRGPFQGKLTRRVNTWTRLCVCPALGKRRRWQRLFLGPCLLCSTFSSSFPVNEFEQSQGNNEIWSVWETKCISWFLWCLGIYEVSHMLQFCSISLLCFLPLNSMDLNFSNGWTKGSWRREDSFPPSWPPSHWSPLSSCPQSATVLWYLAAIRCFSWSWHHSRCKWCYWLWQSSIEYLWWGEALRGDHLSDRWALAILQLSAGSWWASGPLQEGTMRMFSAVCSICDLSAA